MATRRGKRHRNMSQSADSLQRKSRRHASTSMPSPSSKSEMKTPANAADVLAPVMSQKEAFDDFKESVTLHFSHEELQIGQNSVLMRFYRTILRDDRQLLMCCASDFVSATTKLLHAAQHGAAKMLPLYFLELIKSTHKNLVSTLWSSLFAKTAPAAAGVPASSYEDCIGAEQTQKTENSGLERYEVLRQIVPALPARSSELSAAFADEGVFDLCRQLVQNCWLPFNMHNCHDQGAGSDLLHDLMLVSSHASIKVINFDSMVEKFRTGVLMASLAKKKLTKFNQQRRLDSIQDDGNAIWPLHMALAGMDFPGDNIDPEVKAELRKLFGWTLSFSRALHGGRQALTDWFTTAGICVQHVRNKYQCSSQESEASLMVDAQVFETSFRGVFCVTCSYRVPRRAGAVDSGNLIEKSSSLLMYAPIVGTDYVADNKQFAVLPVCVNGERVHLPVVKPQLDSKPPKVVPGTAAVSQMPFLLTPPRIQFMLQLATCMGEGCCGAALTGVSGIGKSLFLKAFSTVVPAGFPCDMLHIGDASDLWDSPGLIAAQLKHSSGPLVDGRANGYDLAEGSNSVVPHLQGNQEMVQRQWLQGSQDDNPATTLEQLVQKCELGTPNYSARNLCETILWQADRSWDKTAYGRVLILDEVNKLLRLVAADCGQALQTPPAEFASAEKSTSSKKRTLEHNGPSSSFWNRWLPWGGDPGGRCFRIQASSPDGARERRPERVKEIFYELRPARFDDLAAILYVAPEFLVPDHGLDKAVTSGHAALARALEACQALCGNMRYITEYIKMFSDALRQSGAGAAAHDISPSDVRDMHLQCLQQVRQKLTSVLADRLQTYFKRPQNVPAGPAQEDEVPPPLGPIGITSGMFGLMAMNASLVVRQDPQYSQSQCDLLGSISVDALHEYLAKRGALAGNSKADQQAAGLFLRQAYELKTAEKLESHVQARLALAALAARSWRLDQLYRVPRKLVLRAGTSRKQRRTLQDLCEVHKHWRPSCTPPPAMEPCDDLEDALYQSHDWWVSADELATSQQASPVWQVRQSVGNHLSDVDPEVEHSINNCLKHTRGRLLIRTTNDFPGMNFVLLSVADSGECSVTFVKVTAGSLRQLGKDQGLGVPPVLRDIAASTVLQQHTARHTDGRWRRTPRPAEPLEDGWKAWPDSSALNFWLRQLGCPLRVHATLAAPDLTLKLKRAAPRDCTPATLTNRNWSVSMVYVSTSDKLVESPSSYKHLHADFVYGIFKPDFDDAQDMWARVPVLPGAAAASSAVAE